MTALEKPGYISVADYPAGELASDVKHEYVDGIVHATAGGTNRHATISGNSYLSLGTQLRGRRCQPFSSDTKIRVPFRDHTRFYYSDIMVVCVTNPDDQSFQDLPVIIVEVLGDSTRRIDLGEKREAYMTISFLRVLILVEQASYPARIYRRHPDGGFVQETHSGLEATIPLPEIDARLPLAEQYKRVEMPG